MGDKSALVQDILKPAGITVNGKKPYDVKVNNPAFYKRVLAGGSLALGEAYMDGWWDCKQLDEFISRVLAAELDKKIRSPEVIWNVIKAKLTNVQSISKSKIVGKKHYDIGNELYTQMLDKNMVYSCGYWKNAKSLDKAQEAKLDLICRKIGLKKGMTVLDIGCGWGSFAKFAAKKYKVKVTGVTISAEQEKLAKERCKGLPIEIRLQDYRKIKETFDRVISIGMFEHVGYKNYKTYMKVVHRCLKDGGLTLLHTIAGNSSVTTTDPWIEKYIFPNSMLPSAKQITTACEGLFVLEDWHSFGPDYDKTLMEWYKKFVKSWPKLKKKYDERFYRMWEFYLLSCAGSFRSRKNQLWQIVLSKNGVAGGYTSIR